MKKDLLFIIIVIAAGLAGLFYTNQGYDDSLEKKDTYSDSASQDSGYNRIGSKSKTDGVDVGVSIPSIVGNTDQYDISKLDIDSKLRALDLEQDGITEPDIKENWQTKLDYWNVTLTDNVTGSTGLVDVTAVEHCIAKFDLTGGSATIDFSKDIKFGVEERSLTISNPALGESVYLQDLKSGISLRVSAKSLTRFCSSAF